MARPRPPQHAIAAALADVAGGVAQPEAASRRGVPLRTLERALAEKRKSTAKVKPTRKARSGASKFTVPEETLLETLTAELRDARNERKKKLNTDAENRAWAKTIRDLVSSIERIAPPAAPPPDMVQAELRRLDGATIGMIEQFLGDAVTEGEIKP